VSGGRENPRIVGQALAEERPGPSIPSLDYVIQRLGPGLPAWYEEACANHLERARAKAVEEDDALLKWITSIMAADGPRKGA